MSGYISELQVNSNTPQLIGSALYGVCETPASTPAKVVILAAFDTLHISGVTVHVKFKFGNTAALNSSLTLAVGSTPAKEISNPGGSVQWAEGSVISFTYDGTADKWQVNDGNVTTITILNSYDSSSTSGISGQGVAAALATLGAAASKGVDTTIPSSSPTDNNVPTSAAVATYINGITSNLLSAADALVFKGTIGANGTINTTANPAQTLPATHEAGWTYKVITAGTYAGQVCEIGDLIICTHDSTTASDSDWTVVQTNEDGIVTGPASSTDAHVALFDGTSGKVIKDSGYTMAGSVLKAVPADAVFTDTTYTATAATTINYLNDADYVKSVSVNLGVLHITTVTNAPTITPVTAITADS